MPAFGEDAVWRIRQRVCGGPRLVELGSVELGLRLGVRFVPVRTARPTEDAKHRNARRGVPNRPDTGRASFQKLCFRDFTLLDDALERAPGDLPMVRHRHGDAPVGQLFTQDDVAATLPQLHETVRAQNLADRTRSLGMRQIQ